MKNLLSITKEFVSDILFPKFCLNCRKEGSYLCQDCFSIIDILKRQYCPFCYPPKSVADGKTCIYCRKRKRLNGLYCAASYNNFIAKKLINQFKYEPYIKELSKPLSSLIIAHFLNLETPTFGIEKTSRAARGLSSPPHHNPEVWCRGEDNLKENKDVILIPVPLYKNKLKQRGFNQAEEIAKELSKFLKIPIITDALIKIKPTPAQVELDKKQRKNNIKGVFSVKNPEAIKQKKILLVDDVFTTGTTMEECAKILKEHNVKKIWGVVVARG